MNICLLAAKPFAPAAAEELERILVDGGHNLIVVQAAADVPADTAGLIVRSDPITPEVLATLPDLKVIVRAGTGVDTIDLAACTARGIVVMNTPGQNSNAVAELVIGLMIYQARNQFQPGTGRELRGRTLGLHGFGNVARLAAVHAQGLGMPVQAFDPFVDAVQMTNAAVTPASSLPELYAASDYLSLHIPALPDTISSINHALLSKLPTGATVINTARKEIVNEEELVRILKDRPDLAYVADVMPDNYQQLAQDFPGRVYATPKKMGAETAEANDNAASAAARQLVDYFATGNCQYQIKT